MVTFPMKVMAFFKVEYRKNGAS